MEELKESKEVDPSSVRIVLEFLDVFPEELTNLPPDRELVHKIELVLGAQLVAKAPYKMLPSKALELKNQLTRLLKQGFIKPSVSPWGAPVLF